MAEVRLERITKKYPGNDKYTVQETSLTIRDREFVVLVGPSGCGKSTLLRMVAGLEDITSGQLYIGDRLVNDVAPKDRDIAMVFQNYALYPHMSVYENIAFSLRLRKVSDAEIDRKVRDVARVLGLEALLDRKPKAMSGGQRQRVALGRAIVRQPKVFLMDEPLSNLDAKLRGQMRAEILKLHQQIQNTIIYVTHDQVEAMTMGDRIVVLNGGYVQQADTPAEVYNRPYNRFVAGFMGSPPMNFLKCRLHVTGSRFSLVGDAGLQWNLELSPDKLTEEVKALVGQQLTMGVRPEDVHDQSNPKVAAFPGAHITAEVDLVEPLGAELYAHLKVGLDNMIGRLGPTVELQSGQQFKAFIDPTRIHLFHPQTELRISR